jgi:tetratricopeptide (TPR) repeat protein
MSAFEKKTFLGYNISFGGGILKPIMITFLLIGICIINACSTNPVPKTEFEFANKLAQDDLWKEAFFRWNKLVEQGKQSAALYNNIAIAYEKMGQFEEAEEAYQKALKLSPDNSTVKSNYEKFKRMLKEDRDKNEKNKEKKKIKR